MLFNPFERLKKNLRSRTLQSSFLQKIEDTFLVFSGGERIPPLGDNTKPSRLGVVDYLLLGTPFFSDLLFRGFYTLLKKLNNFLDGTNFIVGFVLNAAIGIPLAILLAVFWFISQAAIPLAKTVLSGILTLISLPFVGLVEIAAYFISTPLKRESGPLVVLIKNENEVQCKEIKTLIETEHLLVETIENVTTVPEEIRNKYNSIESNHDEVNLTAINKEIANQNRALSALFKLSSVKPHQVQKSGEVFKSNNDGAYTGKWFKITFIKEHNLAHDNNSKEKTSAYTFIPK